MVRILVGTPFPIDAYAINDFETIPDGVVTDLTIGLVKTGNANWGTTRTEPRQ